MRFRYSWRKKTNAKLFANSGDCSDASDLDLHCLPVTLLGMSRLRNELISRGRSRQGSRSSVEPSFESKLFMLHEKFGYFLNPKYGDVILEV